MDYLSAILAWQVFNVFRFYTFRHTVGFPDLGSFMVQDKALWMSFLIPLIWNIIYYLSGYYASPRRKTNLGDLLNSVFCTLIGVLLLFFLIIINDYPESPYLYYEIIVGFFFIHLFSTSIFRFLQTGRMIVRQSKGLDCIPVFVVGTGRSAFQLRQQFNSFGSSFCYKFEGFVQSGTEKMAVSSDEMVGELSNLDVLIQKHGVEELLVAVDDSLSGGASSVLDVAYKYRLPIKAYADRQAVLAGRISLFSLFGIPLYNLTPSPMPAWQYNLKILLDRFFSFLILVLLIPVFLYLAFRVKRDSPGPIFYAQTRVGKEGRLFQIFKFRTMFVDAESDGPMLSSLNDSRVTSYGRFMRKYRLDELPQFWNVLKGDMSLVGPRPEREHFVRQIVKQAPHYYLTQHVLPGITSWGMIKFGYADSIEKMIRRLEYDIIYLENQSLLLDLKILVFTLKPLVRGKGQ